MCLEGAQLLLERDADANARDRRIRPPLHRALQQERPDVAEHLLEHGADANARGVIRWTLSTRLHWASQEGCLEAAEVLEDGVGVNTLDENKRNSAALPGEALRKQDVLK
jgi:ankyrin repeat protein